MDNGILTIEVYEDYVLVNGELIKDQEKEADLREQLEDIIPHEKSYDSAIYRVHSSNIRL